jgi:hypothetical protein
LEYLAPRDGCSRPQDFRANDLAYWQTKLITTDANAASMTLRAAKFSFLSSGFAALPENRVGFKKAFMVCDPDGHARQLIEK